MMKRLLAAFLLLVGLSMPAWAACATGSLPFNLQNNTVADATQVMANFNQISTGVATNCAGSGANTDITSIGGLTTPLGQAYGGTWIWVGGTSTGSANAQVVASVTPSTNFSLTQGKCVLFTAGFTNTGAVQINVFSTGLTNLYRRTPSGPQAMTGGEIRVNNQELACYDGTEFQQFTNDLWLNGPQTSLASATTTDLGTISSHNVLITGVTAITGFGSTASTTFPIYNICFSGALTLTYNATSLILPGTANITTAANDCATALYLGSGNWQVTAYQPATGTAVVSPTPLCGAVGLKIVNDSGTPNTKIDITADSAVMVNPTGNVPIYVTSVSVVINDTVNGANGLDAGALTLSTWYHHWLISNGTTTAGLDSLSATAPTMPGGYTYRCRLGASPTDGSSNFYRTTQTGSGASYTITGGTNTATPLIIANGVAGTYSITSPVLAAVSVTGNGFCAPPTATDINISVSNDWKGGTGNNIEVAPSTAWGATNNGPAGSLGAVWPFWNGTSSAINTALWMRLESSSIAWASNSVGTGDALACLGWKDKVNAN